MSDNQETLYILTINPGGLSTKVALFANDTKVRDVSLEHDAEHLKTFGDVLDQWEFRLQAVEQFLSDNAIDPSTLAAVSGRGGPFPPLKSGVYAVNDAMIADITGGNMQVPHVSSLGPMIARELGNRYSVPAYMVDPVSVDELPAFARLSGLKQLPRRSLAHTLNSKFVARKVARTLKTTYKDTRLVVAHLGSGISVTAHAYGQMVDVNDAMNGGPFSPSRSGTLPVVDLVELCFSGQFDKAQIKRMIMREGGVYSYLGIASGKELVDRAVSGDSLAETVLDAMCHQISKEIGAMAVSAGLPIHAVILTGGLAHSRVITRRIIDRVRHLGSVEVVPGEFEAEALADGALRALREETAVLNYPNPPDNGGTISG